MLSMSTVPKTYCLASATKRLPGPTILFDRLETEPSQTIGQGGDALSAADPVDLGDSQCRACGQDVGVETALRRWRHDERDLGYSRGLGRHNGHEHARRISGCSPWNAHAHTLERTINQAECNSGPAFELHIAMAHRLLVGKNVVSNALDRAQIGRFGRTLGVSQFGRRHAHLARLEGDVVDPAGEFEHGIEPARGHVGADSLDDLPRRERLAESGNRARPPLGADHVSLGRKLGAQGCDRLRSIITRTIDPPNSDRHLQTQTLPNTPGFPAQVNALSIPSGRSVLQWLSSLRKRQAGKLPAHGRLIRMMTPPRRR